MEHHFSYCGSIGVQGGQEVMFITLPMGSLDRLVTRDNYGHALERSQRELQKKRAMGVYNYLKNAFKNKVPFILPPLIGNCDGAVEFEVMGNTNLAEFKFPFSSKIKLFDGQHRTEGIVLFLREFPEASHNSIGMMLTLNQPLVLRQQFFSDINTNASKPAAAVSMAYDGSNEMANVVKKYILENEFLSTKVDFEHNIVPAKSTFWVSYKAMCDATQKIAAGFSDEYEAHSFSQRITCIWNAWVSFSGMKETTRSIDYVEYRKEWITYHGIAVNAFGWAVQELLKEMSLKDLLGLIDDLSAHATTASRDEFFLTKNWRGICVDRERGTLRADVRSQKEAGKYFSEVIRTGKFDNPQNIV